MRNIEKLKGKTFDVLVVGSGVYGAVLAYHLAAAGVKVLVVDKHDFCAATSANSLKILHGGLRYLQHLNFKRMRESIVSRRSFMQFAPHLTKPLGCLVPTAGNGLRSRPIMAMATLANNWISHDRNQGLTNGSFVPAGKTIGKRQLLKEVPGIEEQQLSGGALWYDGLAVNAERLVLEHLLAARDLGAEIINYLRVDRIAAEKNAVTGVVATDLPTGVVLDIGSNWVVNAAGPWYDRVLQQSGIAAPPTRWAKAINLVVARRLNPEYAVGLEGLSAYSDQDSVIKRGKRFFFLVPWRQGTMIGTTYQHYAGDPDDLQCTEEDIREILIEVNGMYPRWGLTRQDVSFYHAGLVPMSDAQEDPHGQVQLAKNSHVIDHGAKGGPKGLISLRSIKYTTAPVEAALVTRMITGKRGTLPPPAPRRSPPVNDALPIEQQRLLPLLEARYGHRAGRILAYIEGDQAWTWWLSRNPDFLFAEIRYFVREEMANTLADVLLRRTDLGTFACPPAILVERVARAMAAELAWDEQRVRREIEAIEQIYRPVRGADA